MSLAYLKPRTAPKEPKKYKNKSNYTKKDKRAKEKKPKKNGRWFVGRSKPEIAISEILNGKGIEFEIEKKFDDLIDPKTKGQLRFDFYIASLNLAIEYDGEQHFKTIKALGYNEKKLSIQIYRDGIKNKYCIANKICLHRIKYDTNDLKEAVEYALNNCDLPIWH